MLSFLRRLLLRPSKMKVQTPLTMRILSHNVRYATSHPFRGEKPWPERKQLVLNQHIFAARLNPETFLCLQEVLHRQLEDLMAGLNTGGEKWEYIGVGRNDGKRAGEYSPILYRPDVWEMQHYRTVWLSETPEKPSKGWDAASIRIVTVGVFRHRASRKTVLAMSTHLDDQGSKSREEAAKLIIRVVSHYLTHSEYAVKISGVFLAGDFNSEEHEEAYTVLTSDDSPLVDAAMQIPPSLHYGNHNTYTGFGYEGYPATRIDHILVGPRNDGSLPWGVQGYGVLPNKFDDGVYNSDHRAVVVDTLLHD